MVRLARGLWAIFPLVAVLLGACEEEPPMYRGRPSDGGFVTPDGGGEGGVVDPPKPMPDLQMNTQGAMIEITEPKANTIVKTTRVRMVAKVTKGTGTEVVQVVAQILGQMAVVPMTLRAGSAVEYEAEVSLMGLKQGPQTLLVNATNTGNITNSAKVDVDFDSGPTIKAFAPGSDSYSGEAPVLFEARGETNLPGRQIKSIKATVQGIDLKVTVEKPSEFLWTGTGRVIFSSPDFLVPLTGNQSVRLEAINNNDAVAVLERPFLVDEDGPIIEPQTPVAAQIVGGVVNMQVKITDPSGVDDATVIAVWAHNLGMGMFTTPLTRLPGSDIFAGRFDTGRLPNPRTFIKPSLSYRAKDRRGNVSNFDFEVILDQTPPVLSLQPPDTQVVSRDKDVLPSGYKCSVKFNPLGAEPTLLKDGEVFGQLVTPRVRVSERGNLAEGQAIEHLSGINTDSVELMVTPFNLNGTSPPLIVDADGKGTCNDMNPLLIPTTAMTMSNQALVLRMANIAGGQPHFGTEGPLPLWPNACGRPLMPGERAIICAQTDLREPAFAFAIPGEIWGLPPVNMTHCVGLQLDSLNVLPEGEYCVAARASDKAGNRNVAKPLRICIERPVGNGRCNNFRAARMGGTLPSCVGRYDPATQKSTTGAGQECTLEPLAPFPGRREPYRI